MQLPHSFTVALPSQIPAQSAVEFPKQTPSQSLSKLGAMTVVFPPQQTPQSSSVPLVLLAPAHGSPGAAQAPKKRMDSTKSDFIVTRYIIFQFICWDMRRVN
jgi:hypothetical protein